MVPHHSLHSRGLRPDHIHTKEIIKICGFKELLDMVWYKLWFPTKSLITVIIPVQSCKFMCALDPSPNPPCTLKMKYFWLLMWRVGGLVRHIQDNMMKARWEPIKCNLLFYFTLIFWALGRTVFSQEFPRPTD